MKYHSEGVTLDTKEIERLSSELSIPKEDILLMCLNIDGVSSEYSSERIRFSVEFGDEKFFIAVMNNPKSSWSIANPSNNILNLGDIPIGKINDIQEDTCDNTYFRRFIKQGIEHTPIAMTLNSNSRSRCKGCTFCGTYLLNEKDAGDNDLTTPDKLRTKMKSFLSEKTPDLSHIKDVGIVTGCFDNENAALEHILMIDGVLRKEFKFNGLLKYIGAQIRGEDSLKIIQSNCPEFGYYFTVECFEKRSHMLRPDKRISLEESRSILKNAKDIGMETSMLYILGLDSIGSISKNMPLYKDCLTRFPIINTMQEYTPGQFSHRTKYASDIRYYLDARNIMENIFSPEMKPKVWENYRGIFFTKFRGEKILDAKI